MVSFLIDVAPAGGGSELLVVVAAVVIVFAVVAVIAVATGVFIFLRRRWRQPEGLRDSSRWSADHRKASK